MGTSNKPEQEAPSEFNDREQRRRTTYSRIQKLKERDLLVRTRETGSGEERQSFADTLQALLPRLGTQVPVQRNKRCSGPGTPAGKGMVDEQRPSLQLDSLSRTQVRIQDELPKVKGIF